MVVARQSWWSKAGPCLHSNLVTLKPLQLLRLLLPSCRAAPVVPPLPLPHVILTLRGSPQLGRTLGATSTTLMSLRKSAPSFCRQAVCNG